MRYDEHVAAVERETALLTAALRNGPVDARVPTCPDWDVYDLADHVGGFTGFWTHVVCEATGREKTPFPMPPPREPDLLADWYAALAGHLVEQLRATTGEQPAWTWVPSRQHVGFIARRCANELAIHRFDAQSARATCEPIEADTAADCVREILDFKTVHTEHEGSGRSLHLCPTDSSHEITLTLLPDRLDLRDEHDADANLVLRGTTSDLALMIYGRAPLGDVDRIGNDEVLTAWDKEFHFG